MAGFEPATAASSGPMALNISSSPDILGWLPEGAQDRLRALRQRISDLNQIVPKSEDRIAAGAARQEAQRRLGRLQAHQSAPGGGFNLRPDDPRCVEQQRLLDTLTADHARLTDLYEARASAWREASGALSNVELWLKERRGALEDHDGPEPTLQKGESITDAIARHRRRVRELRADLRRIQSAPYPSTHARAQMRAQIEALAQRGAPSVSPLVEHDGQIEWPTQTVQVPVRNAQGAMGFVEVPDTVAMFAWMHRDALIKRLDAEIEAEADDKSALPHDVRQKREAEVLADLLACERDECALVWQAQAQQLPVEHRADIDPRALLGVVLVAAPAVSSGTSPGFSFTMMRR